MPPFQFLILLLKLNFVHIDFFLGANYAKEMLQPDVGRLLAPVNSQTDYWLKQCFKVYDAYGNVLWSADDIGAWSVQFQPDVTQDTCQGIWCSSYNGFQKK